MMALPLIPLLLAKVAGTFVVKKAIAHAGHHAAHHAARHIAHETLGSKVVKNAAQKATNAAIDKVAKRKDRKHKGR
jgi:hypothetical protein